MLTKITNAILILLLILGLLIPNCAYADKPTTRNTEIANVTAQIQLDVSNDQPSWMQTTGDVLIIHTHTQEEGEFLLKIFQIPQYIYDEMEEKGWTKKEQREFIMKMNTGQLNFALAWDMFLDGKTTDEIIALRNQNYETIETISNQYLNGEITIEQYMELYPFELETMTVDEVREDVLYNVARMQERLMKNSGLTQTDVDFCRENGITDMRIMAEAKSFALLNKIPFETAFWLRLESADWIEMAQKLENMPIAENNDEPFEVFSDVAPSLYGFEFIGKLVEDGIISGYENGTFRPHGLVTRSELAKLIATAFPNATGETTSYLDIQEHWADEFISKLAGIIPNRENIKMFYPDEPATREECVASLVRVLENKQKLNETIDFIDSSTISADLIADITLASKFGITNGYEDGSFRPKENVTRMEIAAMIYRTLYDIE